MAEKGKGLSELDEANGYLGRLTDSQQEALSAVESQLLEHEPEHDLTQADMLRYLRARDFKSGPAVEMIKASIKWRADTKPLEIDVQPLRICYDTGVCLPVGKDKAGRPALWYFAQYYDPSWSELSIKNTIHLMEAKAQEMEPPVETFTIAFDMTGYGTSNSDFQWAYTIINVLQNHFPERLGKALLVNCPSVFSLLWNLCKPLLSARTSSKIAFLGGDYQTKLKEYFDDENLPASVGGKLEVTPQEYIEKLYGPAPPYEKKEAQGWFSMLTGWGMEKPQVQKAPSHGEIDEDAVAAEFDQK